MAMQLTTSGVPGSFEILRQVSKKPGQFQIPFMTLCFNPLMQHDTIDFAAPFRESQRAYLLVVDDDPFVRDLHATILRMNGYKVATAENGVDALEQLADERFDLLLTDRHMPGIDGASIILALRSAGSEIPVIMVSGSLAQTPLSAAIAREVFAAIPKPSRTSEILSAVTRALSGHWHFQRIHDMVA